MLYPAMADLLKHIDSRYLLVNVIARARARSPSRQRRSTSRWRISP